MKSKANNTTIHFTLVWKRFHCGSFHATENLAHMQQQAEVSAQLNSRRDNGVATPLGRRATDRRAKSERGKNTAELEKPEFYLLRPVCTLLYQVDQLAGKTIHQRFTNWTSPN